MNITENLTKILLFGQRKTPQALQLLACRGFIPLLKLLGGWHYTLPMTPV